MDSTFSTYIKMIGSNTSKVVRIYFVLVRIGYSVFKRLGSRNIHKEMKLQKGKKVVENISCKTDLKHIQRLAYNYNIFKDVHFVTFLSPPIFAQLWYSQF